MATLYLSWAGFASLAKSGDHMRQLWARLACNHGTARVLRFIVRELQGRAPHLILNILGGDAKENRETMARRSAGYAGTGSNAENFESGFGFVRFSDRSSAGVATDN